MAMTLATIKTHVRDTLDLDSTELPDTIMEVWIREGTYDIASRSRRWPDYEQLYTFNTADGTASYTISTIEPANTDTAEIVSIVDTTSGGYKLEYVAHEQAEEYYRNSRAYEAAPRYWSQWGGKIYLWPTPDAVRTMNARAYRKPKDWVADGASANPDLDERLHVAVALYAMIRAYEHQEDSESASRYRELYERYVGAVMGEIFRQRADQWIFNRGPSFRITDKEWLWQVANG